ncbi:unnamed protein product [Mytilus coruscus]|uniref:Uncharacterized protein n=1 Tax=Mytilus coruscus TaxID=42192 RepID=A0A6J8DY54_MYTCO|nr:unnamed protein product [Mytilus coruscus]
MSSGSFAGLSSSEDDDIPQSKIINTSTASFHLQMENSDSGSDEGSKTVEDTSTQEKGPSESPLRKKQRNVLLAPLDLSTPSVQFMPGACGGPADIDTPISVIRRRTSTPISFNTSTTHNYVNMESVNELMKKMMDSQTEILMKTLTDQGENKELSEAICVYVKGQYPTTEEGVIKTGIETYFNTIKQRRQMEEDGKKASHNRKMVLYGRKNRSIDSALKWQEKANKVFSEIDKTSQKLLTAIRLELDQSNSTQLPSTGLPDKRLALLQHKPELIQPLMDSNKFMTNVKTINRSCQTSPELYPTHTRGSRTEAVHYLNLSWKSCLNDIVKLICNGNIKKAVKHLLLHQNKDIRQKTIDSLIAVIKEEAIGYVKKAETHIRTTINDIESFI